MLDDVLVMVLGDVDAVLVLVDEEVVLVVKVVVVVVVVEVVGGLHTGSPRTQESW